MLVGLGIESIPTLNLLLIVAGKFYLQLVDDLIRYRLLHQYQIRRLADIVVTPDLRAGGRVNKIDLNVELIADLFYRSHQHHANVKLAADHQRVYISVLVPKCGRTRDNTQLPEVGKAIDQRL